MTDLPLHALAILAHRPEYLAHIRACEPDWFDKLVRCPAERGRMLAGPAWYATWLRAPDRPRGVPGPAAWAHPVGDLWCADFVHLPGTKAATAVRAFARGLLDGALAVPGELVYFWRRPTGRIGWFRLRGG
jgi:hypothetical protein